MAGERMGASEGVKTNSQRKANPPPFGYDPYYPRDFEGFVQGIQVLIVDKK